MPDVAYTYAIAKQPPAVTAEGLTAVCRDLIAARIVDRPCALLVAGTLPLPLPMRHDLEGKKTGSTVRESGKTIRVAYAGGSSADLFAAIEKAPLGKKDVAVWFQEFVSDKNGYAAGMGDLCRAYIWGVSVVSLREPRELPSGDRAALFLETQGEGGPWPDELEEGELEAILKNHWGSLTLSADDDF